MQTRTLLFSLFSGIALYSNTFAVRTVDFQLCNYNRTHEFRAWAQHNKNWETTQPDNNDDILRRGECTPPTPLSWISNTDYWYININGNGKWYKCNIKYGNLPTDSHTRIVISIQDITIHQVVPDFSRGIVLPITIDTKDGSPCHVFTKNY